jgi:hypothetical protein
MKLSGLVLLSSAAGFALVGGAQAADLPTRKAAPAEYVKICNVGGMAGFVIPGANTCLKISGVVRAELNYRQAPTGVINQAAYNLAGQIYTRDQMFQRTRAYVNIDARSTTEFGDLRSYISLRQTYDTLPSGPAGGGKIAVAGLPAGVKENAGLFQGLPNSQDWLDAAFVSWAGITAGVTHSFFDFYTHNYEISTSSFGTSDQPITLLGYTANFGSGFSASASVEDPKARQIGDSAADVGLFQNNPKVGGTTAAYFTYGAERVPDIVGNLRLDGGWGSAQVAGALHEVNSAPIFGCSNTTAGAGFINCGAPTDVHVLPLGFTPATKWGFALEGGVKIKLDVITPGDNATAQVTYEQGAMDYVNAVNYFSGTTNVYSHNQSISVPVNDAFVLPDGTIGLNKGTGGFLGYQHFWVPTVRSNLFGSYLQIVNPSAANLLGAGAENARVWDVGFNTFWSPVKALDIGAELVYTSLDLYGKGASTLTTTAPGGVGTVPVPQRSDDWRARLRVQMTF